MSGSVSSPWQIASNIVIGSKKKFPLGKRRRAIEEQKATESKRLCPTDNSNRPTGAPSESKPHGSADKSTRPTAPQSKCCRSAGNECPPSSDNKRRRAAENANPAPSTPSSEAKPAAASGKLSCDADPNMLSTAVLALRCLTGRGKQGATTSSSSISTRTPDLQDTTCNAKAPSLTTCCTASPQPSPTDAQHDSTAASSAAAPAAQKDPPAAAATAAKEGVPAAPAAPAAQQDAPAAAKEGVPAAPAAKGAPAAAAAKDGEPAAPSAPTAMRAKSAATAAPITAVSTPTTRAEPFSLGVQYDAYYNNPTQDMPGYPSGYWSPEGSPFAAMAATPIWGQQEEEEYQRQQQGRKCALACSLSLRSGSNAAACWG